MSEIPFLELCISLNYFLKSGHFEQFKIIFQRTKIQSEDHVSLLTFKQCSEEVPSISVKCNKMYLGYIPLFFPNIIYLYICIVCVREREGDDVKSVVATGN